MTTTTNTITEMQKGTTFLELIKNQKIQIPIIQRDYAQGRLDAKTTEIRDGFLTALIDALTSDTKPLVLDFVYGSIQKDNFFIPLDGQQRLTTLFLLHWYFASEKNLEILEEQDNNSTFSKFTYETRISSKDFCNSLVKHSCNTLRKETLQKNDEEWNLSDTIKNQSWFMWSWRKDPTIKSMLVMLDEINERLKKLNDKDRDRIWGKLKEGGIVFHLLPLEKFNLSDELYVKMNARGKELSNFDIFKSTLEEQMRLNNVCEAIQNTWRSNIDSNWIDLFWNKLAKPKLKAEDIFEKDQKKCVVSVEESYLRFLKRMMVFHLFIDDNCLEIDWSDENIKRYLPSEYVSEHEESIDGLRKFSVGEDILSLRPLLCRTKFFNEEFFKFVIDSFESIIYKENGDKHDGSELIKGVYFEVKQKTIFEAFIEEKINYDTRVQFFALLQFFKYNSADQVFKDDRLKAEFNSWMRIVRNLSTNTNTNFYNTFKEFRRSLNAIKKWSKHIYQEKKADTVIDYFANHEPDEGFNREQLKEERVKARLIINSTNGDNWSESIRKAEEHKYFLGQIRFLLDWAKYDDECNLKKFKEYYEKIRCVFGDNGLVDELRENDAYLFRNALMVNFDCYLLNDCCFIKDTGKDGFNSWKRYLREKEKSVNISINIKALLDKWTDSQSFGDFCKNEIEQKQSNLSDWRKYFIKKPEIYKELLEDRISWWNWDSGEICLLSKLTWGSRHRELRTYYWFLKYKDNDNDEYLISTKENPFRAVFHRAGGKEFSVQFKPTPWTNGGHQPGKYVLKVNYDPQIQGFKEDNSCWKKSFSSDKMKDEDIEKVLEQLNSNA